MSRAGSVALRIGYLPSARLAELVSVTAEDTVERAETLMSLRHFDRLPVLSDPFTLEGVISWESIGDARMVGRNASVADAMRPAQVVSVDAEMRAVLPLIRRLGFVFVRDETERISGIVTIFDASDANERLTEPHLMIGEIERRLRHALRQAAMLSARQPALTGAPEATPTNARLTLGKIEHIFRDDQIWEKLGWSVDREVFVTELCEVRKIRNGFSHHEGDRPEPLASDQRERLAGFLDWLQRLIPDC